MLPIPQETPPTSHQVNQRCPHTVYQTNSCRRQWSPSPPCSVHRAPRLQLPRILPPTPTASRASRAARGSRRSAVEKHGRHLSPAPGARAPPQRPSVDTRARATRRRSLWISQREVSQRGALVVWLFARSLAAVWTFAPSALRVPTRTIRTGRKPRDRTRRHGVSRPCPGRTCAPKQNPPLPQSGGGGELPRAS